MVLVVLVAMSVVGAAACVDGVTPDCSDAATGCGPRDAAPDSARDAADGGSAS